MDTLSSSSFLQKYSLTPSAITSSPSLQLLQFKTTTLRIDVNKYNRLTHRTPIKATTSSSTVDTQKQSNTRQSTGRRNQSLLTTIFNSLDEFVCKFIDPPLRPSIDPKLVLAGNFAPVDELPPTACEVEEGSLPPCLDGAYIRDGPNPQFIPRGPYHLFDGDGMLQSIRISKGKAIFCSRFVKTYNLPATLARYTVALGRVLSGQYDFRRGTGGANTSLAHFGGKLFVLCESDLPYTIKLTSDGDIITLGRHEAYGEPLQSMTAHPKVDKETGETFAFRHSIQRPFLTYFRINADGIKQPEVPIFSKTQGSMVHDFAITKNYAIFPDSQIVIDPKEIIKGNQPAVVDPAKVPRLGIITRYAEDESEMWWVEVPGFNFVHAVNAWEEDGGDTIVMVAPNLLSVEHLLERLELVYTSMERIEINVKAKTVTRRPVSSRCLEFGVINPAYVGKKTKYVYAAVISPSPKITGVAKLDLSLSMAKSGDCTVASRLYGPGCYGGEPFFIPREPDNPAAEEDDGYLVNYVFNETTQESRFLVMDAKSPNLEIVAVVKLPQRVPYGFHGIFVRESDLQKL
ncbi:hypothetical protein Pfo_010563 [Paulownia fortunei]|nr:hypothetical protein Pfo_010563 [Paulownia fortunei]